MSFSTKSKLKGWLQGTPPGPPIISGNPTISGTPNGLLTATAASVTNAVRTEFQWLVDFIPVEGERASTLSSAAYPGGITLLQTCYAYDGSFATALSSVFDNGSAASQIGPEETFEAGANNQPLGTVSPANLRIIGGDTANQAKLIVRSNASHKVLGNTSAIASVLVNGKNSWPIALCKDDIGINQRIEIDCSAAGSLRNAGDFFFRVVDEFNYLWFKNVYGAMYIYNVVDGVANWLFSWVYAHNNTATNYAYSLRQSQYTTTYSVRIDVVGSIVRVFENLDGAGWIQASVYHLGNPNTAVDTDFDMNRASASGAALPLGTQAGIDPAGGQTGIDAVRFYSINAPITAVYTATTTYNNVPSVTALLQYAGDVDPTGFDMAVMSLTGTQIVPRMPASSIGSMGAGAATVTLSDARLRAVENGAAYVQVWKTGDGLSGQDGNGRKFDMPPYQTVFPYVQGINDGFTTGDISEPTRDLMLSSDLRSGVNAYNQPPIGTTISFNPFGLPTSLDPNHTDGFTFHLKANPALPAERAGWYRISFPEAYTIRWAKLTDDNGNAAALSFVDAQGSPLPVINGIKQARYYRPASINSATQSFPQIWFEGLTGNVFGPTDRITILKEDDAHPERMVPDSTAANFVALGKVARCMEGRFENFVIYKAATGTLNTKYTSADYPVSQLCNTQRGRPYTAEMMTSLCNQGNIDMHFNALHICDETYWRLEARYVAQNLAPGLKASIEWANEPWNSRFPVFTDAVVEAARLGFCDPGATSYAGLNPPDVVYFSNGSYDSVNNQTLTTVFVPSGKLMIAEVHNKGKMVFRANHDNNIGTVVPTSNAGDANWTLVYDNPACNTARALYQSYISDRLFSIWDEEFQAAGRANPIHVINVQTASGVGANVAAQLSWTNQNSVPMYKRIDRLAIAPYWSSNYNGNGNLGDFNANFPSPTYSHPWTRTEKALVMNTDSSGHSDFTAFKAAFFAIANDAIDAAVNDAALFKHDLAKWLVTKGMSPDAIQMMSYECNWHVQFANWPRTDPTYGDMAAKANEAFGYLIRSPEYGVAAKRYLKLLAERIGGTHIVYSRISSIPTKNADQPISPNPEQQWGLMESEKDNATSGVGINYRFTAVNETLAGDFD